VTFGCFTAHKLLMRFFPPKIPTLDGYFGFSLFYVSRPTTQCKLENGKREKKSLRRATDEKSIPHIYRPVMRPEMIQNAHFNFWFQSPQLRKRLMTDLCVHEPRKIIPECDVTKYPKLSFCQFADNKKRLSLHKGPRQKCQVRPLLGNHD
jgi:hypothetical protein